MIVSRIDGGLGNQMFQYAYGIYLAQRAQTKLLLDVSSYDSGPQHGYLLDQFQIQAPPADESALAKRPARYQRREGGRSSPWGLASGSFGRLLNPYRLRRHKESTFGFDQRHLRVGNHRYLVGYWQSERFFPGCRSELLQHFRLRNSMTAASREVADRIRGTNSAVIHVRRGDYLTDPNAAQIYHSLDLSYYVNCLQEWSASRSGVEVFVFSNDMRWCRANIDLPWKTHWVDHNDATTAHEDMALMSLAACCVIANSTFSWWAAWLNQRADRTIYFPPQWFQPNTLDESGLRCADWIVSSNSSNDHRRVA